jgi:hypothetical protein
MLRVLVIVLLVTASLAQFTPEEEKLRQHIKEVLDSHLLEG